MIPSGSVALDALPDAALVVAADGTLVAANRLAASLFDLPTDAVGNSLSDLADLRDALGARLDVRALGVRASDEPTVPRPVWIGTGGVVLAVTARQRDDGTTVVVARPAPTDERAWSSELVALAAHDLRNPLTSVKGFTATLLRGWDRFTDEQKRTMLETVVADADRVAWLLKTLVEVSRIDAGRIKLRFEPVDVEALAHRAADVVTAARGVAPDVVRVEVRGSVPPVSADADKLTHALSHLVDNALASDPTDAVAVVLGSDAEGLHVQVVDDGRGVPQELREEVFGPLVRAPDAGTAGLGLGLYLVRGVVAAHGGTVWLDPDVTRGTIVHLRLPAAAG